MSNVWDTAFMGVQKLYKAKISQFLMRMLPFLENSLTFFLTTKGRQVPSCWTL